MSLVDKMFEKEPDKNPVFTAVSELKTTEELEQFYQDYIEYMIDEGFGKDISDSNIGYILGYYDDETRRFWYSTLNLHHPIFPRLSTGSAK